MSKVGHSVMEIDSCRIYNKIYVFGDATSSFDLSCVCVCHGVVRHCSKYLFFNLKTLRNDSDKS